MTKKKEMAIVFDLGGVLIDWSPRRLFCKMFNGNEKEMEYFLTQICNKEWNLKHDAGLPFEEGVAERIKKFPDYTPYIKAYFDRWEEMVSGAIEGSVEILSQMKDAGFFLCALSNFSIETFPLIENKYEFLKWFSEMVISGREKLIKPDPAIYELLLKRIERKAEECIFIDDAEENIHSAEELGFNTIQFENPEQLRSEFINFGILLD